MVSICYGISPVLLGARVVRVKAGAYTFLLKSKQPVLGKDAAAETRASSEKKKNNNNNVCHCLSVSVCHNDIFKKKKKKEVIDSFGQEVPCNLDTGCHQVTGRYIKCLCAAAYYLPLSSY